MGFWRACKEIAVVSAFSQHLAEGNSPPKHFRLKLLLLVCRVHKKRHAWHRKALATAVVNVGGIKKSNKRGKCRVTWKNRATQKPTFSSSKNPNICTYVHMFIDMYIYIYIMYVYAPKATHINYVRHDINIIKQESNIRWCATSQQNLLLIKNSVLESCRTIARRCRLQRVGRKSSWHGHFLNQSFFLRMKHKTFHVPDPYRKSQCML